MAECGEFCGFCGRCSASWEREADDEADRADDVIDLAQEVGQLRADLEAMADTVDAQDRLLARIAAELLIFAGRELSISSVQPILQLALELHAMRRS